MQIVEKFRGRIAARHQQMIARTRTGDVEQVALGIIDFLQIRIVAHRFSVASSLGAWSEATPGL